MEYTTARGNIFTQDDINRALEWNPYCTNAFVIRLITLYLEADREFEELNNFHSTGPSKRELKARYYDFNRRYKGLAAVYLDSGKCLVMKRLQPVNVY